MGTAALVIQIFRKGQRSVKNKKTGDGKEESNDSPKILDRRITSDIPGLPLGVLDGTLKSWYSETKQTATFTQPLIMQSSKCLVSHCD